MSVLTAGLTGTGDGTGSLSYSGPLSALNAALAGLAFTPRAESPGYAMLSLAVLLLLLRHVRSRLAIVPASALGKAQLLFLAFLWFVVAGNLMRAIPPFNEQRLITEGVVHLNAVLCTVFILLWPRQTSLPDRSERTISWRALVGVGAMGMFLLTAIIAAESYGTRAIHGSTFVGHANRHMRFGPDAKTGKPQKGEAHP